MKFVIKKEDIERINRALGGRLRLGSSLDFAIAAGKDKTPRQKLALLWRAILVDHPFDDANKRTVEVLTREYANAQKLSVNTKALVKEIVDVSQGNITDLNTIRRKIKYATSEN